MRGAENTQLLKCQQATVAKCQRSYVAVSLSSEFVTFLRAVLRERHDFWAFLGHQYRVLELGREAAVLSADGPAVGFVDFGFPIPLVEHRFNRQTSAGTNDRLAGLQIGEVRNTWLLMEIAADSVALEFADDLEALISGKPIDGSADVNDSAEGLDGMDADPHGIKCGLHESLGLWRYLTDQKRLGRVAVPTIDDRREIDVDDVSLAQQVVVRDAVTNDFVDAGTNCVRVAVVTQAGGRVAMFERVVVGQLVDLEGGYTGSDVRPEVVHEFRVESAGGSEGVSVRVRRVDRNFGRRPGGLWPQQSASEGSH